MRRTHDNTMASMCQASLPEEDFHLSDKTRSQAHWFRPQAGLCFTWKRL
jgi:hypothetical protein